MTLVDILDRHAREVPERSAIVFRNRKISYRTLNSHADRLATYLVENGLRKGDRVGIAMPRIPELIVSFLGVAKAQGVVMPIDYELELGRIQGVLNVTSPRFLIVHTDHLSRFAEATTNSPNVTILQVGGQVGPYTSLSGIVRRIKAESCLDTPDENDVVYLNFTSGSTGTPKGAVTTHANILSNTRSAVEALELDADDVHLCMFAPFAHPHELFARALVLGGTAVLLETISPHAIAKATAAHGVTCIMAIAPVYENLLRALSNRSYDVSSLRILESGGMFTRQELIDQFEQQIGLRILPVWGSTETTGVAVASRPNEPAVAGSIGKVCPSYTLKILDEQGVEVPAGEPGEMAFSGPAVVRRYFGDHPNNRESFRNGFYLTGDIARIDEEGNVFFMERKSGMIKMAGLKVYPLEIEQALLDHPDVVEAAVICAEDRLRGEIPRAIIVRRKGATLTQEGVIEFCRTKLAKYKLPRIVEFRRALPKTGSGKIDKKALQQEEYVS